MSRAGVVMTYPARKCSADAALRWAWESKLTGSNLERTVTECLLRRKPLTHRRELACDPIAHVRRVAGGTVWRRPLCRKPEAASLCMPRDQASRLGSSPYGR